MAITDAQLHEFVMAVNLWGTALYMPAWSRELGDGQAEPVEVDAAHAEADRLGLIWRRMLDELLDGEPVEAAVIARDVHAWGAAEAESARRSAVSYSTPGRPALGQLQLDGESESQAARLRWAEPLVALLEPSPADR